MFWNRNSEVSLENAYIFVGLFGFVSVLGKAVYMF